MRAELQPGKGSDIHVSCIDPKELQTGTNVPKIWAINKIMILAAANGLKCVRFAVVGDLEEPPHKNPAK